ncbi:MAG: Mur ligase family protein [Candidatus Roizmanbacteria bacterium]|nr:Mur ligase family protein [Candidatus Roizmanbacteria bacterium]
MQLTLKTFDDVKDFLDDHIPSIDDRHDGSRKFERVKYFMHLLGDPQNQLCVVHVAGTSGKGSTSQVIAQILTGHGFKTGLTVSPHISDFRERTQINCKKLSMKKYHAYLEEMMPTIVKMDDSKYGRLTFFEIAMAHAYYSFLREKVDYAIVETGMGGRYDASNTATNSDKLCILTKIGLDHQEFLGDTISQIAGEKAEIIHEGNFTLSSIQSKEAEKAIEEVAAHKQSKVHYIKLPENVSMSKTTTTFDFSYKTLQIKKLKLSLHGVYQAENISLAVASVYELGKRDKFSIDEDIVRSVSSTLDIPGRFQIKSFHGKTIVVDGAHNVQKMEAFISSLIQIFPGTQFDFLLAFKNGKDINGMLKMITPVAEKIYITEFAIHDQGLILKSTPIQEITNVLMSQGFDNYVVHKPAEQALKLAVLSSKTIVVITGSMYLVSELHDRI